MTVLFEHLLLYSLQTHSRKSSGLYLPSHTLGVSLFTGLRPLYATGNTKNIQGETPSTTLTTHLDLLCTPSTMLSFFLPSLPLLNTSFYTQPQGLRATSFLQHLCSIHTPPYATSSQHTAKSAPSVFTPILPVTMPPRPHPCISRFGARPTLQLPIHTPHTLTNYILPCYFIPVPFLCSIPASNFPNTTHPKM